MLSSGVNGVLAALSLAFTTNLFGSMTHYASGGILAIQKLRNSHPTSAHAQYMCGHTGRFGGQRSSALSFDLRCQSSTLVRCAGQGAIYFGAGYVKLEELMRDGAIFGPIFLALWGIVGGMWWKVLGLV